MVRNAHILVTQPLVGFAGQVLVLAILMISGAVGVAGSGTGLAYGMVVLLALTAALARQARPRATAGHPSAGRLGPGDWVTVTRSGLTGGVAALTVHSFVAPAPVWPLVGLAAVALALDAVDGLVARRTGTRSRLGERFDMEVDAFLIAVLSVYVARTLGPWVLAIGGMRYALWAAERVLPWLRRRVPPRRWRKVVAALQGIVLTAAASTLFPISVSTAAVAVALALLVESFGRDVIWLWRHRTVTVRSPLL